MRFKSKRLREFTPVVTEKTHGRSSVEDILRVVVIRAFDHSRRGPSGRFGVGEQMPTWDLGRVEVAFAEAAVDPALWPKALDAVAEETQAFGAILLPACGNALPNVPYTPSLAPSADAYFRQGWYLKDERYRGMQALLKNGVTDDFDVMSNELMRRHPYYEEFLAPHGLRWYVGVRVSCAEDLWVLSIQRSTHQDPFSPEEKRRLIRLTYSLPSSIAIARALGTAVGTSALDAFELSQTGAVLVNAHGRVIRANRSAELMLCGDLRISGGRVIAANAAATAALDRALHDLLLRPDRRGLASPVKLPRAGRHPVLAYPGRLPALTVNSMSPGQAVVVLIDPESKSLANATALQHAFELTDAESRLAAMLQSGCSLDNACDRLHIAKHTGRNHLKGIFAKTDTHRQAELVLVCRSILSSHDALQQTVAGPLAPPPA